MKNNGDIPTTDTNEIKQLINRVKRGELDQGDELLIEKLLNILLMIVSLLQRKHTSIRRMKEFLLGMKEEKRGKDETKNRAEDRRSGADGSSQTDSPKEMASKSTCEGDSSAQGVKSLKRHGHGRKSASEYRELSARDLDFYHKPVKTLSPKAHLASVVREIYTSLSLNHEALLAALRKTIFRSSGICKQRT